MASTTTSKPAKREFRQTLECGHVKPWESTRVPSGSAICAECKGKPRKAITTLEEKVGGTWGPVQADPTPAAHVGANDSVKGPDGKATGERPSEAAMRLADEQREAEKAKGATKKAPAKKATKTAKKATKQTGAQKAAAAAKATPIGGAKADDQESHAPAEPKLATA